MLQLTSCILLFLSCLSHCLLNSHVSNFTSIDFIRDPSFTKFPQCNFSPRVIGCPTRSAFSTRREKLHVIWFDQKSLFHEVSSMQFSTEGDRVSYTFCIFHKERKTSRQLISLMPFSTKGDRVSYTSCIFHKERKTSCQLIWSEILLPRTFLNVIFHGGWQGVLHVLHFPQGEKIFTSIDLIKDPSSTNFPPCNFPQGVLHILDFPHREKVRTTLSL